MQLRAWTIAAVVVATGSAAHADGTLTVRGAYYKERATRVQQPMVDAVFEAGETATVDAHLLVDAITSASAASGAIDAEFSERRWEAGVGYARLLGEEENLKIGGSVKLSYEPDYTSFWFSARAERSLLQKNLVIGVAAGVGHDTVSRLMPAPLGGGMIAMDVGELDVLLGSLSVSQILGENTVGGVTYDLIHLDGYQQNPYRRAITEDAGFVDERHPDTRTRHALAASLRHFVTRSSTTLIAVHRVYTDSWGVGAQTPEVRVVQDAGDGVDVAGRYRLHWQDAADFYRATYPSADAAYLSDDVKLSRYRSHTIGVTFGALGHVFGLGGILEQARGELTFEYVAQDNRFGNAVIAHAAMSLPFEY